MHLHQLRIEWLRETLRTSPTGYRDFIRQSIRHVDRSIRLHFVQVNESHSLLVECTRVSVKFVALFDAVDAHVLAESEKISRLSKKMNGDYKCLRANLWVSNDDSVGEVEVNVGLIPLLRKKDFTYVYFDGQVHHVLHSSINLLEFLDYLTASVHAKHLPRYKSIADAERWVYTELFKLDADGWARVLDDVYKLCMRYPTHRGIFPQAVDMISTPLYEWFDKSAVEISLSHM